MRSSRCSRRARRPASRRAASRDHEFIHSIYFRDPNGYVIELTAKVPGMERDMDPTPNHARDILNGWQAHKRKAKAA